jgi:hypothetical protein
MIRRAFALLMVLAIMVVVLAAVVAWVRAAGELREEVQVEDVDGALVSLLHGGERLALGYLRTNAGSLVAPPEGGGWTISDDRWAVDASTQGALSVTIYDDWAGIPLAFAGPRGALRRVLPAEALTCILPTAVLTGADTAMSPNDALARIEPPPGMRVFPDPHVAHAGPVTGWCLPGASIGSLNTAGGASPLPSLAQMLALHSDGRIDIDTAPLQIVREVYRLHGNILPREVQENRRRRLHSAPPGDQGDAALPRLVAGSLAWNCLVTAAWNGRHRSWWVVITGTAANLSIVQRHELAP